MLRQLNVTPDQSFTFSGRTTNLRDAIECDCAAPWTDAHIPRTDKPVYFVAWLALNVEARANPSLRLCRPA